MRRISNTFAIVKMVDSIVMIVLKSAAGWLWERGKQRAAETLKHGNGLDRTLYELIQSDLDSIKDELRAQRSRPLFESIEAFRQGIISLSDDNHRPEYASETDGVAVHHSDVKISRPPVHIWANEIRSDTTKGRFREARWKARELLSNQQSPPKDIILARYIEIMATFLEEDKPTKALKLSKSSLEHLHKQKEIVRAFRHEFSPPQRWIGGGKSIVERRNLIWFVCHVNRVLFDMAQEVGDENVFEDLFPWPCIEIEQRKGEKPIIIDPLRNPKFREGRFLDRRESRSVLTSFSQEGDEEQHKMRSPRSIAETTQGNFLVVDNNEAKIFDTNGKYVRHLRPFTGPLHCHVLDLDIDKEGNIYLLVRKDDNSVSCYVVFIFEKDCSFHGSFQLRSKYSCFKLASRGVKTDVLVMNKQNGDPHSHSKIEVYETKECKFVSSFGGRILMDAKDLVCDGKGNTFVLDKCHCGPQKNYIRMFDKEGIPRHSFMLDIDADPAAISIHHASRHIVLASIHRERKYVSVSLYKSDGKFEHKYLLKNGNRISVDPCITVTRKARIIVVLTSEEVSEKSSEENKAMIIVI